ncbi:hypothetical protein ACROYT_G027760 [Oculina patagonica]
MATATVDPYEFNDEDYVPSRENDFSDSFMKRVFGFHWDTKENEAGAQSHGKKRKADPSRWKRNVRKAARNSGQEYTDCQGRPVPARKTGPDCGCDKLECFKKVDLETRNKILADFNAMGEFNAQNSYLHGLISAKRESKRSYVYFVQDILSNRIQVCRKAFCSIHGITIGRVRTVRNKQPNDLSDKRGRHANRPNRISEETKQKVFKPIEIRGNAGLRVD